MEESQEANSYDSSINFIKLAIESLSAFAKDDDVAKEAIANLSVIMMDLM